MKCTPANRMISASTDCALTDSASESPRKSATSSYFGQRIVMGQYDGMFLAFQFLDPISICAELSTFIFYFYFLI